MLLDITGRFNDIESSRTCHNETVSAVKVSNNLPSGLKMRSVTDSGGAVQGKGSPADALNTPTLPGSPPPPETAATISSLVGLKTTVRTLAPREIVCGWMSPALPE